LDIQGPETSVETGEPGENHRPVASHWQTITKCRTSRHERGSNSRFLR